MQKSSESDHDQSNTRVNFLLTFWPVPMPVVTADVTGWAIEIRTERTVVSPVSFSSLSFLKIMKNSKKDSEL
jgi:hypothetical protein